MSVKISVFLPNCYYTIISMVPWDGSLPLSSELLSSRKYGFLALPFVKDHRFKDPTGLYGYAHPRMVVVVSSWIAFQEM